MKVKDRPRASTKLPAADHHVVADQSDVLDFLARADTYGVSTSPTRIDTHAAVIFLAGSHAYKMKRAVRFPFLDLSTLERRRRACEAEVEINRRSAPEIYLGTMPVMRHDGMLRLGGEGTVVEWLVGMRRFDPNDTLDHVAERGALSESIISDLVDAIAAWHADAAIGDGDAATARLSEWMRGNFDELGESPEVIAREDVERLRGKSEREFQRRRDLLLRRGRAGHVRRCHGDLHLRNVVLIGGRPVLFDALEFDDAFATHDVFYDLAYLLMDLWQRGLRLEANHVLNRYFWRVGDMASIEAAALLPLLMSIRAAIRAKVAVSTAAFEQARKAGARMTEARRYLAFAEEVLTPVSPRLIAIGGLSGSGKTTVATRAAPELGRAPGAIHLRSDVERKRMFGTSDTDRLPSSTYTQATSDAVYARLRDKADRALKAGQSVVVDAVHGQPAEREAVEAVARDNGVPFAGFWLDAPEEVLLHRVAQRSGDASDADAGVVKLQSSRDTGPIPWRKLDASRDVLSICRELLSTLRA